MRFIRIIIPLVILSGAMLLPATVFAARIYLVPTSTEVHVGDTITIDVMLDTEQESVNAVDLAIIYPQLFSIKSISRSGSVMTLWIQDPNFNAKNIVLQGGVPGGIVTGRGIIARVVVRASAVGTGILVPDPSSKVLLNDGSGTPAHLTVSSLTLNVSARAPSVAPGDPEPTVSDTTSPNSFSIDIGTDPSVFSGKHFASFFTTDAGSGMDHYEISQAGGEFRVARSPFLLEDQKLHSVLRVRAYDAAGNWREEVWPGFFRRLWWWIIGIFGFR